MQQMAVEHMHRRGRTARHGGETSDDTGLGGMGLDEMWPERADL